ncbi:hypothetical protein HO133_010859 [Letharia lupina]|uniref:F-box domain-containing protein n=1 Tax=Letharia lupina TaxID=560253 RepID=A0A8H6FDW7_9LECA|nr:uncharacterized protein HO133_010859 [Letharia lupina]KAF6224284.1 hypothetical protein HO133_010859 [Letharia lupina]
MSASKSDMSGPSRRFKGKSVVMQRPEGRLYLLDLPLETQKQIIAQVSRKDLFSFQRVSPHFLSLASAEIYRDLDLKITNSGDEENGVPSSHAADALQTVCASEHDYGQHIKSFRLGVNEDSIEYAPRSLGHVGQDPFLMTRLLWDSKSDSSKFLNTALLLVARRLRILETFQWDAPIEISGAVYQALHKIQSLRCLRIRLDISPSPKLIIRPSPSPPNPSLAMQQAMQAQMQNQPPLAIPTQFVPPPPGPASAPNPYPNHTAAKINNIKRKKAGSGGGLNYWANGRAFSGFKSLHTLTIVGMSNHDCLSEIAECIKASSASLKCLTLSLSTELARKSRKPMPINNPELDDPSDTEMDDEDELSQPPQPPTGSSQAATTTNEADIRREKLAQESILAKVFDLQSVSAEGKKLEKTLSLSGGQFREEEDSQESIRMVNQLMKSLMDSPLAAGSDATSLEIRLQHLKMIKDVAERYISNQETQKLKKLLTEQNKPPTPTAKKAASKPLNPLASGFKPSSTSKGPNVIDHDFETLSSPTSPYFASGPGDSLSNGTPKPFSPSGPFSSLDQSTLLSYLPGGSSSKPVSSQPYTSPYVAGSYAASANQLISFPYEHSNHSTTGFHSPPGYSSPLQAPSSGAWGITASNKDAPPSTHKYVSNIGQNQKTKHKPPKKPTPAKKGYPFSSEDESEGTKTPPSAPQPFFAASVDTEAMEGSMDVDMEHPDDDTTDLGEDQEIIAGSEGAEETATPRKRAKVGLAEIGSSSNTTSLEPNPSAEDNSTPAMSSDEAMQAYIRATHGLQLEELSLEWVPLKASIVARALDLSVLKRLTLLEVGPQDAFWTLLVRLQSATQVIAFKSIHTDNVSLPFVKFLATFEGLEELFMLERNKKQAAEPESESTVTISTIRKGALRKHMPTLQRLSLRNERNEQWDVDPKTLRGLALKGTKLRELAFSLSLKTYHILMQLLPHLKSLYALHIITLRSTDRSVQLPTESISFAVDNLSHCPNMKLRYIAMMNQVTALEAKPEQFRRHLKAVMDKRKDRKGKGKAPADVTLGLFVPATDDSGSDDVDDILADMGAGETKLKFSTRFADVKDVKIFSKEVRGGKL